jgi:hypothetical protein
VNKWVFAVLVVLLALGVAFLVSRDTQSPVVSPSAPVVEPSPFANPPLLEGDQAGCDSAFSRSVYLSQKPLLSYQEWCTANAGALQLDWQNKHRLTSSDEAICSWNKPDQVAAKCEGKLSEDDPFMVASGTVNEVGGDNLAQVVQRARPGTQLARDIAAFRKLGLQEYATVLEKADAVKNERAKLDVVAAEWAALEEKGVFVDWFQKHCAELVKCSPH